MNTNDRPKMTYAQLKQKLSELSEDQLKLNVTIFDQYGEEYIPITIDDFLVAGPENDIMDENHPYIRVNL